RRRWRAQRGRGLRASGRSRRGRAGAADRRQARRTERRGSGPCARPTRRRAPRTSGRGPRLRPFGILSLTAAPASVCAPARRRARNETGERAVTLNSHLVFVSVDAQERPRPVGLKIEPRDATERALAEAAQARRQHRLARFAEKAARIKDVDTAANEEFQWRFESARSVLPEDALFGNMMFPGKMLLELDEAGGILSMRYCKGLVMTACLDAMDFYTPIYT